MTPTEDPGVADILAALGRILVERRQADPDTSYAAALYAGGLDAICAKLGEETGELIGAARAGLQADVIHETADLWFHTLVLLAYLDLDPEQVLGELRHRYGRSGHAEKRARIPGPDGDDDV